MCVERRASLQAVPVPDVLKRARSLSGLSPSYLWFPLNLLPAKEIDAWKVSTVSLLHGVNRTEQNGHQRQFSRTRGGGWGGERVVSVTPKHELYA